MNYWLIPYLVIYNAGDPNNWKYGPEHVFKVEVQGNATVANMSEMHSNVTMYIPCRPLNTKLIHCHVESATIDNYEIPHDTKIPYRPEPPGVFEIGDIMFQVEFNENGVSMVKFANTNDSYRTTMIRSVVDNLNLAINIMNLKNKNSTVGIEKSNMGICHTKYFMHKDTLSTKPDMETILDRSINLKVAMRGENSADAINNDGETMIVIEKIRQSCGKKSPYFFGHDVDDMKKHNGIRMKTELISSRSRMILGPHSFSCTTENTGTLFITSNKKPSGVLVEIGESIRVSFDSIRAAKEELPKRI